MESGTGSADEEDQGVFQVTIPSQLDSATRDRLTSIFLRVLDAFKESPEGKQDRHFDPTQAIRATWEHAIAPSGPDHVLCRFLLFVTHETDLQRASDRAEEVIGSDDREGSSIMARVAGWARLLLCALLAPMASWEARKAMALPTPPELDRFYGMMTAGVHYDVSTPEKTRSQLSRDVRRRDHHRCVITGFRDLQWARCRVKDDEDARDHEGNLLRESRATFMKPMLIIPHSMFNEASVGRDVLHMLDPGVQHGLLDPSQAEHPRNVLCLSFDLHWRFADLSLALDPAEDWTPHNHHYYVGSHSPVPDLLPPLPANQVTLVRDVDDVAMPSERFLRLHAACARIVNKCDATFLIHKLQNDLADAGVKRDGSTRLGDLVCARVNGLQLAPC